MIHYLFGFVNRKALFSFKVRWGNTVCALEFVRKIIAVIESAGKCDFGYSSARLVFEHILRLLKAQHQNVFGKSKADFALEGADIFKYTDHVKNITADYVINVAKELFKPEAYTMSVVEPI